MGSITGLKNRIRALIAEQGEEVREEASRVKNLFGTKGMKVLIGLDLPAFGQKNLSNPVSEILFALFGRHQKFLLDELRWRRSDPT